jgi:hypothetical protein
MANLILNGSTSGSVTLSSPAVSGTTTLTLPTTSGTVLTNGTNTNFPAGSVLQVVSAVKTDTASSQSATFSDIVTVSITPTSASSKILILASTNIGISDAGLRAMTRLTRDSTTIFIGDSAGSRERASWQGGVYSLNSSQSINHTFLDSPATTSAITYKLQFRSELTNSNYTVWVNRTNTDSDGTTYGRGATSITVMEIKG